MEQIFREIKGKIAFSISRNLHFPAHVHDDIELVYTRKGGGTAYCDGKKYALNEGTWFLTFPNQVHSYGDCAPGEYYLLILKPSTLLRYNGVFMEGVPKSALCCPREDSLVWLLEQAYREYTQEGFSDIIAAYLTAIMGKLLGFYTIQRAELPGDTVQKILQFCADHYREELTVETVAGGLGLSRSSVSHIFSQRIGAHFCDYVNALRLSETEKLLRNQTYTITEVANLSGFSTLRTFNRAFRKKYGISPTAYRKTFFLTKKCEYVTL